ncbi:MAG: glycosyltransferase family 4 protein [Anaerolineales bacterium]
MKIAQVIDTLDWGGAQKMMTALTRALLPLGVEVAVFSLDSQPDPSAVFASQLREMGVEVCLCPGEGLFNLARARHLAQKLREGHFDLVQTYLTYANILGALAGRMAGIPVIASIRSAAIDPRHYNPVRHRLESLSLRFLARGILVNGYSIAEFHQPRVGKTPIRVIPNAISLPPLPSPEERQRARRELVGGRDGPIVISVGRLSHAKGYPDLLDAFAALLPDFPGASLVIVGSGEMETPLRIQAANLGLQDSLFLTGARQDIPPLLAASDLYVSASHWEGMSVALLEGMAAALPVVATYVGDAPYMVTRESGTLVPPRAPQELSRAMRAMLENPELMRRAGQAARQRVAENYSAETWAQTFLHYYREMTGQ